MIFDFANRNFPLSLLCTAGLMTFFVCLHTIFNPVLVLSFPGFIDPSKWINPQNNQIAALIVVALLAIVLYRLNMEHQFLLNRSHLIMLLFVSTALAFGSTYSFSSNHFASILLLVSVHHICLLYRVEYGLGSSFYSGLFLAFSVLFFSIFILFLPALLVALFLIKPIKGRSFFAFFAGLVCPYLFVVCFGYFNGDWAASLLQVKNDVIDSCVINFSNCTFYEYLFMSFCLFLIFGNWYLSNIRNLGVTQKYITLNSVIQYLAISSMVILIFFTPVHKDIMLTWASFICIPICNFFGQMRSALWSNCTLLFFFALAIMSCLSTHY